jgi:hypothetical protein
VGDVRQRALRVAQRLERGAVLQRREVDDALQLGNDVGVDQYGLAQPRTAVRKPVAGRIRRDEGVDRARLLALVDDGQLQARRACVDD